MARKDKDGNPIDNSERKGNLKKVKTMRFIRARKVPFGLTDGGEETEGSDNDVALGSSSTASLAGTISAPIIESKGGSGQNCWVLISGPSLDEDFSREYCELSYTPQGGAKVIIETGDIYYPFDGTPFFIAGLAAGTYTISAMAIWSDSDPDTKSVNVTLP